MLGVKLRELSESVTQDAAALYKLYGLDFKPKWFPVFHILKEDSEATISQIATDIGHSHPSVVKIVQEMKKEDIVASKRCAEDGRKTKVFLTEKGKELAKKIQPQYEDVTAATAELLSGNTYDLWNALEELDYLLQEQSLLQRVLLKRKEREAKAIQIVPYEAKYHNAFKALNQEWIEQYFKMEEADHRALDQPESYILDKGGQIFVALLVGEAVGVCALVKMNDSPYDFELAKMAVSPKVQGRGVGYLLGKAILEEARQRGARNVYLESNTKLTPALRLYQKLGFQKIQGIPSPYERSNIQMVVEFAE